MISRGQAIEALTRFFKDRWYDDLQEFALDYPDSTSLKVDYLALISHSRELEEVIEQDPSMLLEAALPAIHNVELTVDKDIKDVTMRLYNYPYKMAIRDIRHTHILKYLKIEGIIRRASEVKAKYSTIAYKCLRCEHITYVEQPDIKTAEPFECENDTCGKKGPFKVDNSHSTFRNFQVLEVQESPDSLRGTQPQNLTIYVYDDLAGTITAGDKVTVAGVLRTIQDSKTTVIETYLEANHIDRMDKSYDELVISEEDKQTIFELASRPDIKQLFVDSIAPAIFGLDDIKEALALQLVSGVARFLPDGTRLRGDTHILLIGDPGTAKSQLVRSIVHKSPRGIFNSGKSASAVGLTAAVVKDSLDDRWTLEGGALVLADNGLCAVDEMDKMRHEDHSALHEAMEQQVITVSKAGIYASLNTRCAMIGAANPVNGRFDKWNTNIGEQINMTPTLLSRFDLIFVIQDRPDRDNDSRIAEHIARNHSDTKDKAKQPLDNDIIRKYVAYARANIKPELSDEAKDRIVAFYVDVRNMQSSSDAIPITARSIDGLIRLAEASAKLRLSNTVTIQDANDAIRLVSTCLKQVGYDESTGIFDVDMINASGSMSQRAKINQVMAYTSKVDLFTVDDLLNEFTWITDGAQHYLDKLKRNGTIQEVSKGVYQRC